MAHANNLNAYVDYAEQPGIFVRLRQAIADQRAYLETYEELDALSDRALADFGLSRLNIRDVAREATYGHCQRKVLVTSRGRSAASIAPEKCNEINDREIRCRGASKVIEFPLTMPARRLGPPAGLPSMRAWRRALAAAGR